MDSLLASYASSDEEGDEEQPQEEEPSVPTSKFSVESSSIFPSLPQPKSSSLSFSLPPPKSNLPNPKAVSNFLSSDPENKEEEDEKSLHQKEDSNLPSKFSVSAETSVLFSVLPEPKSSSVFSSIPPPKSRLPNRQAVPSLSSSEPNPKRVVQFKPPIAPSSVMVGDSDDEDEVKERKPSKEFGYSTQTSSVKSFLSSIPAPKNSMALGVLPSSGSGRRAIVEMDVPVSDSTGESISSNADSYKSNWVDGSSLASFGVVGGSSEAAMNGGDISNWSSSASGNFENYDSCGDYGNYSHYGQDESNWVDKSSSSIDAPNVLVMEENFVKIPGKRGRNEVPVEIVEVKQDELMKNRPREDQVKLTGIAFGPSYQPVSAKGKPSKLHKRKHQIGSLYFEMKQKEMELAERRAQGFLTKAQTQGKYGW